MGSEMCIRDRLGPSGGEVVDGRRGSAGRTAEVPGSVRDQVVLCETMQCASAHDFGRGGLDWRVVEEQLLELTTFEESELAEVHEGLLIPVPDGSS